MYSLSSVESAPFVEVWRGYQVLDETTLLPCGHGTARTEGVLNERGRKDRISGRGKSHSDLPPASRAQTNAHAGAACTQAGARRAAEHLMCAWTVYGHGLVLGQLAHVVVVVGVTADSCSRSPTEKEHANRPRSAGQAVAVATQRWRLCALARSIGLILGSLRQASKWRARSRRTRTIRPCLQLWAQPPAGTQRVNTQAVSCVAGPWCAAPGPGPTPTPGHQSGVCVRKTQSQLF